MNVKRRNMSENKRELPPFFWEMLVKQVEGSEEEEVVKSDGGTLGWMIATIFGLTFLSRVLTKITEVLSWVKRG